MAVYVDKVHMVADSLMELHSFAQSIGLPRRYFEGMRKGHPHYDLVNKVMLIKAVRNGAIVVRSREILAVSYRLFTESLTPSQEVLVKVLVKAAIEGNRVEHINAPRQAGLKNVEIEVNRRLKEYYGNKQTLESPRA